MSSLNIKLSINQCPICLKLFMIRSSDLALTNIQIATICQQSNNLSYKYQLRILLRKKDLTDFQHGASDYSLILYPFENQNSFSIQIPTSEDSSKTLILIEVHDNGGSIIELFEKVISQPANITCTQMQFEKINLQSKIKLPFQAFNKKCDQLHNRIFIYFLYSLSLPDLNDYILKFQAIKQQKYFQSKQHPVSLKLVYQMKNFKKSAMIQIRPIYLLSQCQFNKKD
ncbi:unnamed protein product [Paramecium sonneborni]|uniref:Uncharacterized protein n=1 Tax=Paramecium sonneborni TaxID=65129 RepID=A0A8S1PEE8_9CILI|nr:unnamed protein product [Paramecium sonneborni]